MASNPLELHPEASAIYEELRRLTAGMSTEQKAAWLLAGARLAAAQADRCDQTRRAARGEHGNCGPC